MLRSPRLGSSGHNDLDNATRIYNNNVHNDVHIHNDNNVHNDVHIHNDLDNDNNLRIHNDVRTINDHVDVTPDKHDDDLSDDVDLAAHAAHAADRAPGCCGRAGRDDNHADNYADNYVDRQHDRRSTAIGHGARCLRQRHPTGARRYV